MSLTVEELYNKWPYPKVSFLDLCFAKVDQAELPLLSYESCYEGTYGSLAGAVKKPRILVVGCGTFEAVAVQKANPSAEIFAIDLSDSSLNQLKRTLKIFRLTDRVNIQKKDFLSVDGKFDYIIATGVLHHFENPQTAFNHLASLLEDKGVARIMVYSAFGRSFIYEMKKYFSLLGADAPKKIKKIVELLPAGHPYKIYFYLYSDTKNDSGIADGFLHPVDNPFTALSLEKALEQAGLEFGFSLQSHIDMPENLKAKIAEQGTYWRQMQIIDALSLLRENFRFVLRKKGFLESAQPGKMIWHPLLKGVKKNLYSRILGKSIYVNTHLDLKGFTDAEIFALQKAKFILKE
ncbi:MAG: class I SAM-dependent methyltransferase [Oligoflexia bacterium]|nr:class I SAM-dependent methyltransferase [Oligoflexia bacterium]